MAVFTDTLLPQPHEIFDTFHQFGAALVFALNNTGFWTGSCHIRPAGQLAAIVKREIEQSGQHHGGQLNRYRIDPVKFFIDRHGVQQVLRALANECRHFRQAHGRNNRCHGFALHIMLGLIHGNKHRQFKISRRIGQNNGRLGRKTLMVCIDRHNILIAGHRPIWADGLIQFCARF